MANIYVATTGNDTTGNGSVGNPYRTILKASQVAVAGDVVNVADGTYAATFTISSSGTSGNRITYRSTNRWGAKIVPASSTSDTTGVTIAGDNIIFDGFDVDGQSNLGWRIGIYMTGSNITVQNCHVHHIARLSACDANGGGGIVADGFDGQSGHVIDACEINHIGPGNPGSCGTYSGVYMQSNTWTVSNCKVYFCTGDGLTSYHDSRNGNYVNNTSFNNGRGLVCSGGGFYHVGSGGPFNVHNNIVYDNNPTGGSSTGGIAITGTLTGTSTCRNNHVTGNLGTAIGLGGGVTSSGNITTGTPGFVNYQEDGTGDYTLTAGSACRDAGLSTFAPSTDFNGGTRPVNGTYDIGAYEYGAVPPDPEPEPEPPTPAPPDTMFCFAFL